MSLRHNPYGNDLPAQLWPFGQVSERPTCVHFVPTGNRVPTTSDSWGTPSAGEPLSHKTSGKYQSGRNQRAFKWANTRQDAKVSYINVMEMSGSLFKLHYINWV